MFADPTALGILIATFLLAGAVKGVIGLGLPTVSLALLAIAFDLVTAMALLLIPSLITNLWQAVDGGYLVWLLRRLWPFLTGVVGTIWFGVLVLGHWQLSALMMTLGVLLLVYGGLGLSQWRPVVDVHQDIWMGPVAGAANGILTGMTGSFVFPGVVYLQALGLSRDQLVQAMGLLFSISTLVLGWALQTQRLVNGELLLYSLLALLPALFGMAIGRWLRKSLSEIRFRQLFFCGILLLGGSILLSAVV